MVEVFVLGGGTPTPTEFRFGSAHALRIGDEILMFDCGPAVTHKLVKAGLYPTQVDNLFFTRHHFDHNIDYPCFLLCRWDQSVGNENDLKVFGPPPTEQLVSGLIAKDDGANFKKAIAQLLIHDLPDKDMAPIQDFFLSPGFCFWDAAVQESSPTWMKSTGSRC